jgi:hypothetical protein
MEDRRVMAYCDILHGDLVRGRRYMEKVERKMVGLVHSTGGNIVEAIRANCHFGRKVKNMRHTRTFLILPQPFF